MGLKKIEVHEKNTVRTMMPKIGAVCLPDVEYCTKASSRKIRSPLKFIVAAARKKGVQ